MGTITSKKSNRANLTKDDIFIPEKQTVNITRTNYGQELDPDAKKNKIIELHNNGVSVRDIVFSLYCPRFNPDGSATSQFNKKFQDSTEYITTIINTYKRSIAPKRIIKTKDKQ